MHATRPCQLDVEMTSTEHIRYKYKICYRCIKNRHT